MALLGHAVDTETEREAAELVGVDAAGTQHVGVHHAAAAQLEPRPVGTTDVELGAKFKGQLAGVPTRVNFAAYQMWVDDIQRSNYVQIFGALAGITVNVPEFIQNGERIRVNPETGDYIDRAKE